MSAETMTIFDTISSLCIVNAIYVHVVLCTNTVYWKLTNWQFFHPLGCHGEVDIFGFQFLNEGRTLRVTYNTSTFDVLKWNEPASMLSRKGCLS